MKTKVIFIIIGMLFLNLGLICGQTATAPADGDGSSGTPYQISSLENLYWIAADDSRWDKHYIQTADIDAAATSGWDSGAGWTPIGNSTNNFTGVYDGGSYEIQNLFINRPATGSQGLFGYCSGAEIKNLGVTDADIKGNEKCGIIFAAAKESSKITNCYSTGSLESGEFNTGGVGAELWSSSTTNCYSTADITSSNSRAGGIIGFVTESEINNCYYSGGTVSGVALEIGGIAGYVFDTEVNNCYSEGTISGDSKVGGIAGNVEWGSIISKCYSKATAAANDILQGALCGFVLESTVENCFWDTEVSGNNGGIGDGGSIPNSEKSTAEMKDIATFTNTATDGLDEAWDFTGTPNNDSGSDDIWIIRSGVNDGYPYFNSAPEINDQTFNVDENSATGTVVGTVLINEPDGQSIIIEITEGNTNDAFAIDHNGELTVDKQNELDYETTTVYNLNVSVTETSAKGTKFQTSAAEITININDINEPPVFSQESYTAGPIDEYAHGNNTNPENGDNILTIATEDLDRAGPVKEKIEYQNVYFEIISGNINDAFKIALPAKAADSEHTAYITVNNKYAVDYETVPEFNLIVKAYDDGTPTAFSTVPVTITLNQIDEAPLVDEPGLTNIPGIIPLGEEGSGGGGNPPVTIIYEDETIIYYFYGYDPEGQPIYLTWSKNGENVGFENTYTFVPEPLKDGEKSREYTMLFTASDQSKADPLVNEWKIMVLNNDNPIVVNELNPAPNTSTDPSISTAGGSYNMTEGETINFSVDADDPDGSLLWRNWYVNDELVWLDPDFDFNTHFMSSGGSPYDIKLYLQGQQGDYQEFHWTVNVSNKEAVTYANAPMLLSGSAMIEGLNAESGDAIAAYSGDELRGETLLSNSEFSDFEVNLANSNEEISFVIYDSDNNVIKTVHRTLNGETGTAQNIIIHGYEEVSSSFALSQDWNYVSFNTIPEDNSVSSVFSNTNISEIRTSTEIYNPSNPEFLNTLKEIKPGIGYLVKMNSNSSIFVNGYSAENSEIQLYEGWNLIGYTERSSADIETAFGSIMDKIIEIKSEIGVYSTDMPAYMNTLSYIEENKAYWVKCSDDCVLDFPRIENKENYNKLNEIKHFGTGSSDYAVGGESTLNTYSTSPTRPPVDVSFGNIAVKTNSFVVYAEISNPSDNTLCAYSNNELRGISQIIENSNKYYTSIVINSDIADEKITLKIGDNTIKTISSIPGTTIGKENLLLLDGSLENEIPASFKVSLFPNPFNPEINISFELPKTERINISVFDINGKLVKTLEDNVFNSGKHSITWNGTDSNNDKMASGIYFVKVKSDSYNTTEKIVMIK